VRRRRSTTPTPRRRAPLPEGRRGAGLLHSGCVNRNADGASAPRPRRTLAQRLGWPLSPRLHSLTASAVALLCLAYAVVLTAGLLTLPSPQHPIQDPWFTLMELLILAIAPAAVGFMVVLQARASEERKPLAIAAVAFSSMCAVITCCVHFSILTLSRQPLFAEAGWARQVFSFRWPSLAYALDILAWDFFFALAAFCGAATIAGGGLQGWARRLLYLSAALAFVGLAGVPLANMQIRNIGILGYAGVFPVAAALLAKEYGTAKGVD
jgi:hypothetical protein